jgi:hypothetical protein
LEALVGQDVALAERGRGRLLVHRTQQSCRRRVEIVVAVVVVNKPHMVHEVADGLGPTETATRTGEVHKDTRSVCTHELTEDFTTGC